GDDCDDEATALRSELDTRMYGVRRTMVNGERTMAAIFTILRGKIIRRTRRSGPAITNAVFSKTVIQSVRRTIAFAKEKNSAMERGIFAAPIGMLNASSIIPRLTM